MSYGVSRGLFLRGDECSSLEVLYIGTGSLKVLLCWNWKSFRWVLHLDTCVRWNFR